jgi:hypothetical protein
MKRRPKPQQPQAISHQCVGVPPRDVGPADVLTLRHWEGTIGYQAIGDLLASHDRWATRAS